MKRIFSLRRILSPTKQASYQGTRWYHEVSYKQYGKDPKEVLSYRSDSLIDDLDFPSFLAGENEEEFVRVEMRHVPWNPADVNTVQGRYPSPYESSSASQAITPNSRLVRNKIRVATDRCIGRYFENDPVIGSEGWGRVTHSTSSSPSALSPGTLVTLGLPGLGTLRSSLWLPASAVLPVPEFVWEQLGPAGCSLFQLGGTALRLLSDFVDLKPGDVVLQNAGGSGVGFLASQLAASSSLLGNPRKNIENDNIDDQSPVMVSLIRRRGKSKESFEKTVEYLRSVGKNAFVVAEEDFFLPEDEKTNKSRSHRANGSTINKEAIREMRERLREISPSGSLPKLALNAVGGNSARLMLKLLEPNAGSTMVTYGGMSGKGVQLGTPQLIFSDVQAVGYWHSRWMVRQYEQEQAERKQHARGQISGVDRYKSDPRKKFSNHRIEMVNLLSRLVQEEDLKCPPAHTFRLENLQEGLLWQANQSHNQSSDSPYQSQIRGKLVWDCSEYKTE